MDQRQTSAEHRKDPTVASRITVNIYLDREPYAIVQLPSAVVSPGGYTGGEFEFVTGVRDDGSWETTHTRLNPEAGDAVCFYQAVPEFSHAVPALKTGTKTIQELCDEH